MKGYIYTINHPITDEVRYIGKTVDFKARCRAHFCEACRRRNAREKWVDSWLRKGVKPTIAIIDEIDEEESKPLEAAYIQFFRDEGFHLLNGTLGGDGSGTGTNNHQFGRRGSLSPNYGKPRPESVRQRIGEGRRGIKRSAFSPQWLARLSASKRGKKYISSSSQFVNVGWCCRKRRWRAYLKNHNKFVHVGYFTTEKDAALAYDRKATQLFGASAVLNFP